MQAIEIEIPDSPAISAFNKYLFANLPTGYTGAVAFCINARKSGEGVGAGTGCPVYFNSAAWYNFYDNNLTTV